MPRWTFETIPGAITEDEKLTLVRQITDNYVDFGIPAFLVNVFFHENALGNFHSGGKSPPNTIFFHIDHAATPFVSEEHRSGFIGKVNDIVRLIMEPKGVKWEYNIYEHPRRNWRVNGLVPPVEQPERWQEWMKQNKAVVYEDMK